jgi:lysozyme
MTLSLDGLEFIKRHEGLKLESYRDSCGVLTIGYGHTGNVVEDQFLTPDQAEFFLQQDTAHAMQAVNRLVRVDLTQNQFDALVSFTFNVGVSGFGGSTVLARLNRRDYDGAADALLWWDKGTIKGKKQKLAGLTKRRRHERNLFLDPEV